METNQNKIDAQNRPAFLIRTKSLREILSDLRKAEMWLLVAALAAFLASAFFVVKYFVGGEMTPNIWTGEQWANAFLGLGLTAVITAAQAFLYASGYKGQAALIATFIVVFFGLFSEISQSMEREDATVRARSEGSAVFKATLGSITALSSAPAPISSSASTVDLSAAQRRASKTQTRIDNKNKCNSCETTSFRELRERLANETGAVAAAQTRVNMEMQSTSMANSAALKTAIETAKGLEYDEDKHYAMIRLLKQLFGVTAIWASFFFSVVIIGTFEYAFHFVGSYVADHKRALKMLGRDARGKRLNIEESTESVQGTVAGEVYASGDTWNDKLAEFGIDSKNDAAMNQTGDKEQMERIVKKGMESVQGTVFKHKYSEKRFYKLLYTEIRNLVLNGEVKPTVRPITDAIAETVKAKGHQIGIMKKLTKPEMQEIATIILRHLESETVVDKIEGATTGQAKFKLAEKYQSALLK